MILIIDNGETYSAHVIAFVTVDDDKVDAVEKAFAQAKREATPDEAVPFVVGKAKRIEWLGSFTPRALSTMLRDKCGCENIELVSHALKCDSDPMSDSDPCNCWVAELYEALGIGPWRPSGQQ